MNANLGVIEGFFGRSWSFQERLDYADFLKKTGYQFYIYAPKNDPYLRKSWQQDWPAKTVKELQSLVKHYHTRGIAFGVGLSPFEVYKNYDEIARDKLIQKIENLNQLDIDIVCLLFDDMRGDFPNLAKIQIQMTKDVLAATTATKVIMCPTYYSYDPILEKVFGKKPNNYLEDLGSGMPSKVDFFWTGPKVCSNEYPKSHLLKVAEQLKRKPFLWDNYPVNDGAKMCKHLHLKAFNNRPSYLAELTAGHAVNPMNQPYLSRIPLQTLPISYSQGIQYNTQDSLQEALTQNCGLALSKEIKQDIDLFQLKGLDQMTETENLALISKYKRFNDDAYASEIVAWLSGDYAFDPECLTD